MLFLLFSGIYYMHLNLSH